MGSRAAAARPRRRALRSNGIVWRAIATLPAPGSHEDANRGSLESEFFAQAILEVALIG
jgi:hypothetical protein